MPLRFRTWRRRTALTWATTGSPKPSAIGSSRSSAKTAPAVSSTRRATSTRSTSARGTAPSCSSSRRRGRGAARSSASTTPRAPWTLRDASLRRTARLPSSGSARLARAPCCVPARRSASCTTRAPSTRTCSRRAARSVSTPSARRRRWATAAPSSSHRVTTPPTSCGAFSRLLVVIGVGHHQTQEEHQKKKPPLVLLHGASSTSTRFGIRPSASAARRARRSARSRSGSSEIRRAEAPCSRGETLITHVAGSHFMMVCLSSPSSRRMGWSRGACVLLVECRVSSVGRHRTSRRASVASGEDEGRKTDGQILSVVPPSKLRDPKLTHRGRQN
mmetsp:Transcript_5232/g.21560  ORF Transcript_5232/g.21560 Transcript_5232/m.21560 type:complete len:332 (-) Transcript_5232:1042-2037(-)